MAAGKNNKTINQAAFTVALFLSIGVVNCIFASSGEKNAENESKNLKDADNSDAGKKYDSCNVDSDKTDDPSDTPSFSSISSSSEKSSLKIIQPTPIRLIGYNYSLPRLNGDYFENQCIDIVTRASSMEDTEFTELILPWSNDLYPIGSRCSPSSLLDSTIELYKFVEINSTTSLPENYCCPLWKISMNGLARKIIRSNSLP
jgi:hypothetical protein